MEYRNTCVCYASKLVCLVLFRWYGLIGPVRSRLHSTLVTKNTHIYFHHGY